MIDQALLKKLPLFSDLPTADLTRLAALLKVHIYQKHEVLFSEGEAGLGVWLVLRGAVKLVKTDRQGGEQLLKVVAPEQFFAEVVLFDGGSYPATAIAQSDCTLAVLYNADARALLGAHPELAWRFLHTMSERLRTAQERIRILSGSDATVRLASILLHIAKEQGEDHMALSKQDLANMAGIARETVSRILAVFRDEGCIIAGRNKIAIVNKRRLAALIDDQ
ncbi:MAG: Cyclic AMP receptor protein [Firmicutes bacterium]|nr:Cyclic AMP receptor protein [candidate division NPL-UPA2 bacterium]MBT9154454.1 Cyclic AMP receptor protein [candidate division NPL-UPA2 bacterium]